MASEGPNPRWLSNGQPMADRREVLDFQSFFAGSVETDGLDAFAKAKLVKNVETGWEEERRNWLMMVLTFLWAICAGCIFLESLVDGTFVPSVVMFEYGLRLTVMIGLLPDCLSLARLLYSSSAVSPHCGKIRRGKKHRRRKPPWFFCCRSRLRMRMKRHAQEEHVWARAGICEGICEEYIDWEFNHVTSTKASLTCSLNRFQDGCDSVGDYYGLLQPVWDQLCSGDSSAIHEFCFCQRQTDVATASAGCCDLGLSDLNSVSLFVHTNLGRVPIVLNTGVYIAASPVHDEFIYWDLCPDGFTISGLCLIPASSSILGTGIALFCVRTGAGRIRLLRRHASYLNVLREGNVCLSVDQNDLLCWYHPLICFGLQWIEWIQRLSRSSGGEDTVLPTRVPTCLHPPGCQPVKAHKRSDGTIEPRSDKMNGLKRVVLKPGEVVLSGLYGFEREKPGEVVLSGLHGFEREDSFRGVDLAMRRYRVVDIGRYRSAEFHEGRIDFSVVGVHPPSGVAERASRTISERGCSVLSSSTIHWPEQTSADICPFALKYAICLWKLAQMDWKRSRVAEKEFGLSDPEISVATGFSLTASLTESFEAGIEAEFHHALHQFTYLDGLVHERNILVFAASAKSASEFDSPNLTEVLNGRDENGLFAAMTSTLAFLVALDPREVVQMSEAKVSYVLDSIWELSYRFAVRCRPDFCCSLRFEHSLWDACCYLPMFAVFSRPKEWLSLLYILQW